MSKKNPAKETLGKDYVIEFFNQKNEITNSDNVKKSKYIDEITEKWNMNHTILNIFKNKMERDQYLKEKYAIILISILAVELVALIVIFILNGCGVLKYSDATFNLFITGGIAEVFVLVKVIVNYLFKDNLTNALNIILESNNKINSRENNKKKNMKNITKKNKTKENDKNE